jgi:uncharacterized protein
LEAMTEPVRTCIGCGAKRPKATLVRMVAFDGRVEVDEHQRAPGRGAYVCSAACAQKAVAKRVFGRALRGRGAPGERLIGEVQALHAPTDQRGAAGAVDQMTRKI